MNCFQHHTFNQQLIFDSLQSKDICHERIPHPKGKPASVPNVVPEIVPVLLMLLRVVETSAGRGCRTAGELRRRRPAAAAFWLLVLVVMAVVVTQLVAMVVVTLLILLVLMQLVVLMPVVILQTSVGVVIGAIACPTSMELSSPTVSVHKVRKDRFLHFRVKLRRRRDVD